MSHKPEMIHTQVGATEHKDKTTRQNPQVIHQCQHPFLLLIKTEKQNTRKKLKCAGLAAMLLWIQVGIVRLKP